MSNDCAQNYVNNNNMVLDQAFCPSNSITPDAIIDFAYLSNKCFAQPYRDLKIDNVIELDPYDLSLLDFTSCFYYQSAGNFNINLANKNFQPLLLNNQTYTSTDGKKYSCNLYTICLKAYTTINNISENTISASKKISTANQVFLCQSLATCAGNQNALSWDVCLNTLQITGQIVFTGDTDHEARVACKLTYVHYLEILNVTVSIIFTYRIRIPCYKNVYSNIENNIPFPYSKYEQNSIEEIKKELQESLAKETIVKFNPIISDFNIISLNEENNNHEYDDDGSIGCESTIKTCALLKEICSGLFNNDDEIYDVDEVYEDDEDIKDW